MSEQSLLTVEQCAHIRSKYSQREGLDPLAAEYDIDLGTLRYHLYGDCSHDLETEPITPPTSFRISADECRQIREAYADGESAEDIQQNYSTRWRAIVRHLTGSCSHEDDGPTVSMQEIYDRHPVSSSACAALRERYLEGEYDGVIELSKDVKWAYQTVLTHLNGDCNHELEITARSVTERGGNVSAEECKEIRAMWREDPEMEIEALAATFDNSPATLNRHVKFLCSHDYERLLVDQMDILDQWLAVDQSGGHRPAEVLESTEADDLDVEEVSADAGEPERVQTTRSRIVRNTPLVNELKEAYEYECQVCGETRHRDQDSRYAEGHHLQPLGKPHEGPDDPENILILCPNHHADFDYGTLDIDPDSRKIRHAYDDCEGRLTVHPEHRIGDEYLRYHREQISVVDEMDH